jgi:hypothetical protein
MGERSGHTKAKKGNALKSIWYVGAKKMRIA